MESTTFKKNNSTIESKRNSPKMAIIPIVKAYLFMVLNEYFVSRNGVNCSESREMSFYEDPIKGREPIEKLNVFFNEDQEKLSLKSLAQDNSDEKSKNLNYSLSKILLLSTAETETLRNNISIDNLPSTVYKNLCHLYRNTMPFFKEHYDKMSRLLAEIKIKIDGIKNNQNSDSFSFCGENFRSNSLKQESPFFKDIELFYTLKKDFYEKVNSSIKSIKETYESFDKDFSWFDIEYQKNKESSSDRDLNSFFKQNELDFCNAVEKSKLFMEKIVILKSIFENDIKLAEKIISNLSKIGL